MNPAERTVVRGRYVAAKDPVARFMKYVSKTKECWIWTGALIGKSGYGLFWHAGRKVVAHRWYYEQMFGEVPKDKDVCHKCDVRRCVNPDPLNRRRLHWSPVDMKRAPDQVTFDLRRHEAEQDAAEIEYEMNLPRRKDEAMYAIQDPNELGKLLNDPVLAGPLARMMYNLKDAQKELAELQFMHRDRVQEKEIISLRACIQSLAHIEMMLFNMAMGDE